MLPMVLAGFEGVEAHGFQRQGDGVSLEDLHQ